MCNLFFSHFPLLPHCLSLIPSLLTLDPLAHFHHCIFHPLQQILTPAACHWVTDKRLFPFLSRFFSHVFPPCVGGSNGKNITDQVCKWMIISLIATTKSKQRSSTVIPLLKLWWVCWNSLLNAKRRWEKRKEEGGRREVEKGWFLVLKVLTHWSQIF